MMESCLLSEGFNGFQPTVMDCASSAGRDRCFTVCLLADPVDCARGTKQAGQTAERADYADHATGRPEPAAGLYSRAQGDRRKDGGVKRAGEHDGNSAAKQ